MPRNNNTDSNFDGRLHNKRALFHHDTKLMNDLDCLRRVSKTAHVSPILLYGPPQSGKSFLAKSLAVQCPDNHEVEVVKNFTTHYEDALRRLEYLLTDKDEETFKVIVIDDLDKILAHPEAIAIVISIKALFDQFSTLHRLVVCTCIDCGILANYDMMSCFSVSFKLVNVFASPIEKKVCIEKCVRFYTACSKEEAEQVFHAIEPRVSNYGRVKLFIFMTMKLTDYIQTSAITFDDFLSALESVLRRTALPSPSIKSE